MSYIGSVESTVYQRAHSEPDLPLIIGIGVGIASILIICCCLCCWCICRKRRQHGIVFSAPNTQGITVQHLQNNPLLNSHPGVQHLLHTMSQTQQTEPKFESHVTELALVSEYKPLVVLEDDNTVHTHSPPGMASYRTGQIEPLLQQPSMTDGTYSSAKQSSNNPMFVRL